MTVPNWKDVESAAVSLAGNHYKFDSFAWSDRPENGKDWCLVYTKNRDSGLIDQSNADAIDKELRRFFGRTVRPQHHSHWAFGYVDGYAIQVYRTGTKTITAAFRKWCDLQTQLADYPLLDESDHSEREYNAAVDNIESEGNRFLRDEGAPEDWARQVFSWLWNSPEHQIQLENTDDQGACPSKESIQIALAALGWLDRDYLPAANKPQEGDYITSDYIYWSEFGTHKLLLVTADPNNPSVSHDEWARLVELNMKVEGFHPNAWHVTDHGNIDLIDLERAQIETMRNHSDNS